MGDRFYVDKKEQVADMFTKALGVDQLCKLLDKLGTRYLHALT